jgi:ankyrin repeat protein
MHMSNDMLALLLEYSKKIDADVDSIFQWACYRGQIKIVKQLFQSEIYKKFSVQRFLFSSIERMNEIFEQAWQRNNHEMIEVLLRALPRETLNLVNIQKVFNGETIFAWARKEGHLEIVELLLNHKDIMRDLELVDQHKFFHELIAKKYYESALLLLLIPQNNIFIDLKNPKDYDALLTLAKEVKDPTKLEDFIRNRYMEKFLKAQQSMFRFFSSNEAKEKHCSNINAVLGCCHDHLAVQKALDKGTT